MKREQILFGNWLDKWLNFKSVNIKKRTMLRYYDLINLHIKKHLGNYLIENITLDVAQNYINFELQSGNLITNEGLSTSSLKTITQILKSSMEYAVEMKVIKANKLLKLKSPRLTQKLVDAYSLKDQMLIENYILNSKRKNHFGIMLCLYTGLRLGELLALKWEHIDFENNVINVVQTFSKIKDSDGKYKSLITSPKSESSQRVIPIPPFLLKELKKRVKMSNSEYVISTNQNKIVSPRSYQRTFESIIKGAKVPKKNFHSLRHTFATRALENGMDIKTLSEIMGHKSPVITLSFYGHSLIETKRKMINNLSKISLYNSIKATA